MAQKETPAQTEAKMKAFTLRWVDVFAGSAWVTGAGMALAVTAGVSALRAWTGIVVGLAVLCSFVSWLSRRLERLEDHVYTEGVRAGFNAKQVVNMHDHERL